MAAKKKREYYVIAGNINGSEREPMLRDSVEEANTAIAGTVIGALGEMSCVSPSGVLGKTVHVEMTIVSPRGTHCRGPWRLSDFAGLEPDERIVSITLRNRRSCHTFAEWTVTKVTA